MDGCQVKGTSTIYADCFVFMHQMLAYKVSLCSELKITQRAAVPPLS